MVHFKLLFFISFWHLKTVCEMKKKNPRKTSTTWKNIKGSLPEIKIILIQLSLFFFLVIVKLQRNFFFVKLLLCQKIFRGILYYFSWNLSHYHEIWLLELGIQNCWEKLRVNLFVKISWHQKMFGGRYWNWNSFCFTFSKIYLISIISSYW